ncbi:MAG: DNA-processing protein DprA [Hyphomicrobiales bacterium]|nr:DNA-processing protein DprA [Hyphomicrobiales bacterium]
MTDTEPAKGVRLSDEQRLAWLRLIRSERVGPATFRTLINQYGTASAALAALPDLARRGGASGSATVFSQSDAEAEMRAAERVGARFIGMGEPDYPTWLRHADQPPPLIAVRGAAAPLAGPAVAIVGSRNASIVGQKIAGRLGRDLGTAGFTIVSGLARGIDAAAHKAALETGTIAVFAGGVDIIYPAENEGLFAMILDAGGCAISEMPMGLAPRGRDFPRRNRIIAGASLGTIVVEAAKRSGSLITARLALEQNREVMAVPGSPLDPRAAGTNGLLKQGARLVTEAKDVIEALAPLLDHVPEGPGLIAEAEADTPPPAEPDDSDRGRVMEGLGPVPTEIDEIIRHTGVPARTVRVILLELDLAGKLEHHPGNRVSLI